MNKGMLVTCLFLIVFSSQALAWFNDLGNDSCLTIYSDQERYPITEFDREIEAEILISNNCGSNITDADIGLFVPTDLMNLVKFKSVHKFRSVQTEIVNHSYVCDYDFDYNLNPKYAECFINDANGEQAVVWGGYFDTGNIGEKTVYWDTEEVTQVSSWRDVTQVFANSVDLRNVELGIRGFDLKLGWKDVTIPQGNTRLKIAFTVPFGYQGNKEFVLAGRSKSKRHFISILDPEWYDTGYEYRKQLSITFQNDVNAGWPVDVNDLSFCNGGKCQPDKEDVILVYDGNQLDRHLELNPFTDANRLWFELPQYGVATTTDNNAWVYYGNPAASYSDTSDFNLFATDFNSVMYRFEEDAANTTVYDYGDKQFNATATTNTSNLHKEDGFFNSDFNCNSLNSDAIQYPKPNLEEGTIEMFVKLAPQVAAGGKFLTGSHTAGNNKFYVHASIQFKPLECPNPVNGFCIKYEFASSSPYGNWDISPSSWRWDLNTWTHIAVTWGSGGSNLYIDGVAILPSPGATGQLATPTGDPYICARNLSGVDSPLSAEVDGFKISSVQKTSFYATYYGAGLVPEVVLGGEEEIGQPPSMTAIDLNVAYSPENGDILVTASNVDDFEDGNVSLLCGTAPNPTVDTNNFCTDYSVASPYSSVSCVGQGAAGNSTETVYCRVYDGEFYSLDQNTDTYIADNNAPTVEEWYLRNDLNGVDFTLDFWVQLADAGVGAKGAYYGLFKNGVLDSNGFQDVNGSDFSVTTSPTLDINGDNSYIIWTEFIDDFSNSWQAVIKSGTYQFFMPSKIWTFGSVDLNTDYDYNAQEMIVHFGKGELIQVADGQDNNEFYGFDVPGNYTTSNTEVVNSACTLYGDQNSGYCDTNFLSVAVADWRTLTVDDNFDDANTVFEYHNDFGGSDYPIWGTSVLAVDFNESAGFASYDLNFEVSKNNPNGDLHIYLCGTDYNKNAEMAEAAECTLIKTYTSAEITTSYEYYQFPILDEYIADNNRLFIAFACEDCTQLAKRYEIPRDQVSPDVNITFQSGTGGDPFLNSPWEAHVGLITSVSGIVYQYTTDDINYYYVPDGNLEAVDIADQQIKIRSNLTRVSSVYDLNVFSLNINYITVEYPVDSNITPKYAFTDLNSDYWLIELIELSAKPGTSEIKYQLTDDNGLTYYWHNGSNWVETTADYAEANTAAEINNVIPNFDISGGEIKFRAFLRRGVGVTPSLYNIDLDYILKPKVNQVLRPVAGQYYNSVIDVNVLTQYTDTCDINLLNSSFVPIENLGFQLSVNPDNTCITSLDTTGHSDGSYYLTILTWNTTLNNYVDTNTASAFYIDNTAPTVLSVTPATDITSFTPDYNFFVVLSDSGIGATDGNCSYGIYKNGILDENGTAQTYLGDTCRIGYTGFIPGDTFYLVTNIVTDSLGNSQLDIQKSGGIIYQVFPPADPENITDEEFLKVGWFAFYRGFGGLATFLIPFFGLIGCFVVLVLIFKRR